MKWGLVCVGLCWFDPEIGEDANREIVYISYTYMCDYSIGLNFRGTSEGGKLEDRLPSRHTHDEV